MKPDIQKLQAGKHYIEAIKARKLSLKIPVGNPVAAYLRPIPTAPGSIDAEDVRLLSKWRNENVSCYLTEFVANSAQTAHWLSTSVHTNDGKILCMLEDMNARRIGAVGLCFIDWQSGYAEPDNLVRGIYVRRGLMQEAFQALLDWGRDQLGLVSLVSRVRSDNTAAIAFHKKLGFNQIRSVPLSPRHEPGMTCWYENPGAQDSGIGIIYMTQETYHG